MAESRYPLTGDVVASFAAFKLRPVIISSPGCAFAGKRHYIKNTVTWTNRLNAYELCLFPAHSHLINSKQAIEMITHAAGKRT